MGIERNKEIRRRRTRRNKIKKLRLKLAKAKSETEREGIVKKLERIHPFYFDQAANAQSTAS